MKKLTIEQATIIGAYTGILCGDFHSLHQYIEKKLGHPVLNSELGDEAVMAEVKAAAKADFLALIPEARQ